MFILFHNFLKKIFEEEKQLILPHNLRKCPTF